MFILITLLGGAIYLYTSPGKYRSEATVTISSKEPASNNLKLFHPSKTSITEEITSVPFLTEALKESNTLIRYYSKQDYRTEATSYRFPYTVSYKVSGNEAFTQQDYMITPVSESTYNLTSYIHGITRFKKGTFGEELIDNNLTITITKKDKPVMRESYLIKAPVYCFSIESPTSLAQKLASSTNNLRVTDNDGLITISCQADHPDYARDITTAITNRLMGYMAAKNLDSQNNQSVIQLDDQLENISMQLSETENQIAQFKKSNNITEMAFDTEKSLAVMKELQLQKTQLEMKMAALDNLSTYLRKNRDADNSMVEYGAIDDPQFSLQLSLLNEKYQLKNSGGAIAKTDAEIEIIKSSIAERILNTRKRTAIQIEGLQHAIKANQKNLSTLPEKASALMALDRKLQLDKKVYDLLSDKRASAIVDMQAPISNARILKPASTPLRPVSPNLWMVIGLCILGGMLSAIPIAVWRNSQQKTQINKREQIEEIPALPFMGTIDGSSKLSTSVNNLCTKLMMREDVKMVTFASAGNIEGKSFIASKLAQALSAIDKKVLLLDMNLEHSDFAAIYHTTPPNSLADVLTGNCDVHDAICLTSYPNLELLEAGNLPSGINTLISSPKKNEIFHTLKSHYDYIIINTTEMTHHIDAIPMMKMSELNLFVVKANTSRKQSLVIAEQVKKDFEITNLYCLLNTSSEKISDRKSRVRDRDINVKRDEGGKPTFVPAVLRRIALWFY